MLPLNGVLATTLGTDVWKMHQLARDQSLKGGRVVGRGGEPWEWDSQPVSQLAAAQIVVQCATKLPGELTQTMTTKDPRKETGA